MPYDPSGKPAGFRPRFALTLLGACIELPDANVPPPPPEDTAPIVTGVEIIADPPWVLGKLVNGPHTDPRLHYVEGKLIATWVADGTTVQIAEVPLLDPSLAAPYEVTDDTSAGARPDAGTAEQRLVSVWTTPAGTVTGGGVLQGGALFTPLSIGYGAVHGSVRLDLAIDGAADLVWTTGTEIKSSGFDRLLVTSEPVVTEAEAAGNAFDAVAAPSGGGFVAVWSGATGLQVGVIPPTATALVVLGDLSTSDPNIATREDRAWATTWLDAAGTAWFRTNGAPQSAPGPFQIATGASTPVIVWVDERVAVAWTVGTALTMALYDLDGTLAAEAIPLGEASGRSAMAARAVNDAWEITLAWPSPSGELSGTFVVVIDRTQHSGN